MVNIPFVKKLDLQPGEKIPQWVIVELQGDLQTDNDMLAGQEIGTIHLTSSVSSPRKSSTKSLPSAEDKAIFLIGNYALMGETVDLKKPFLVVRKSKKMDADGNWTSILEVDAVIRKKLIFRERPKDIIPKSALPKETKTEPVLIPASKKAMRSLRLGVPASGAVCATADVAM